MAATAVLATAALAACGDGAARVTGPVSGGLVFVRVGDGGLDLARLRLADGALAPHPASSDADESWPYWSPVARALVFQRAGSGSDARPATSDLWLWRPSGGDERGGETNLTATPRRDERWPVWSPTEARLVYAFRGGTPAAGLAQILAPPGPPELVAPTGADALFLRPAFAPDGRALVVQRRGARGRGSQLWSLAPGVPPRPLTRDPERFALKGRYTRDGARIVFSERPASGGPHDVASLARDGGDRRSHASLPDADDHSASPSPTRDEIAFVSDRGGHSAVWLASLAGDASPRVLAPSDALDQYAPRWSPDGERLVVTAVPRGEPLRLDDRESLARARLQVLDRDGSVRAETPGLMPDWMPAW